jgi:hypothetical protein
MCEPNKKKVKKEDYHEKINEIGTTIRNNNLKKETKDNVQKTYGEIIQELKKDIKIGPPAPTVPISPWLSSEENKKNDFPFREPPSPHIANVSPWLSTKLENDDIIKRPNIDF